MNRACALILAKHPANLAVLPVKGVEWDDLGDPARVLAAHRRVEARHDTSSVAWATR